MSETHNALIAHLNALLKNKLTGINQYFLHARVLKHQGHVKLADYEYKSSIDIMKHSDMLVEHILSLGGSPNLQELGKLMIGETVEAMLENDLAYSEATLAILKDAISFSETKAGNTAGLLRKILDGQQEHINFLRDQLNALEQQQERDYA